MNDILTRGYCRSESSLRNSLTRKFKSFKFFVQNIESGATGVGIPDMYVECSTMNMWIEVKTLLRPKKITTKIRPNWRPGQLAWAEEYKKHRVKGEWFLVIQVGTDLFYTKKPQETYDLSELKPFTDFLSELK